MKCWLKLALATILLLGVARVAPADIFELANGSQLVGTWVNADQKPVVRYVIRLGSGAEVVLGKDQVQAVKREPSALASYRKALTRLPDTAEAHWEMAQRCGQAELSEQQAYHLRRVVELDPEHEQARRALGYVRIRDEWVLPDEHYQELGYVRHKGKWKLPQEVELEARKEQAKQEVLQWRGKIKRWRTVLLRGKAVDQQAALAGFREIRSPHAVDAIAKWLSSPKEPRQLKELYIDTLGNLLPDRAAASVLVESIIRETDMALVDRAIDQLKKHEGTSFAHLFTRYLKSKDNRTINRAAYALGQLGDTSVIPSLIDALVTKHRKVLNGPGISTGFGRNGNSGLTAGQGSKIAEFSVQNESVKQALTLLSDGINHEYNKQAWRRWYARTRLPDRYDIRRDQ